MTDDPHNDLPRPDDDEYERQREADLAKCHRENAEYQASNGNTIDWDDPRATESEAFEPQAKRESDEAFEPELPRSRSDMSNQNAWAEIRRMNGSSGEPEPEPQPLGEWDAGDDTEKPEPRAWLLGHSFCRQFISSLIADGGVGKTAARIAQALSLATGRALTGEHVFVRSHVLIVSLEDDAKELRRRILAARLHYGIPLSELKGWLFLAAPGAKAGKLKTVNENGQLVDGELKAKLEITIKKHKIDLVILDPFVKAHSVPENSNDALDDVAQMLSDLATELNIAVDLPHHVSKGPPDPGNAQRGRGASALVDAGRLCYTLTPMSPEDAKTFGVPEEERRQHVRLDKAKVNLTPAGGSAKWFKLVGVKLDNGNEAYPNGDEIQVAEPWTPKGVWADLDEDLLNRLLNEINVPRLLPQGTFYTARPNAGERAVVPLVRNRTFKTEAQARQIVQTWIKNGVLVEFEYRNPETRKDVKGLRVEFSARPGECATG
jgi:hypothetical protein